MHIQAPKIDTSSLSGYSHFAKASCATTIASRCSIPLMLARSVGTLALHLGTPSETVYYDVQRFGLSSNAYGPDVANQAVREIAAKKFPDSVSKLITIAETRSARYFHGAVSKIFSNAGPEQVALKAMLHDIASINDFTLCDEERYFVAKQGQKFGVMIIREAPYQVMSEDQGCSVKQGDLDTLDIALNNSLYIDGLAADKGSKLGRLLLEKAQALSRVEDKSGVSLAADERDLTSSIYHPQTKIMTRRSDHSVYRHSIVEPYSVASYYEKRGFEYTGQAFVDEVTQQVGPIYFKPNSP